MKSANYSPQAIIRMLNPGFNILILLIVDFLTFIFIFKLLH